MKAFKKMIGLTVQNDESMIDPIENIKNLGVIKKLTSFDFLKYIILLF